MVQRVLGHGKPEGFLKSVRKEGDSPPESFTNHPVFGFRMGTNPFFPFLPNASKDQAITRNSRIETPTNRKPYRDSYQNLPEGA
jgi:hypothetical protein